MSDPSALTTQQLLRELGSLREIINARLDGMDKILGLLQSGMDNRQQAITAEVTHLRTLHEEKFHSISIQFSERDTRTEQTSKDSKVAVDAALQAAKEAVGEQNKSSALAIAKSENSTTKQIDQIGINIQSTTENLNDKIDDVKARLLTIDGLTTGSKDHREDGRANIAIGVSLLMAVISVGAILYAEKSPPPVQSTTPVLPPITINVPPSPPSPPTTTLTVKP